MILILSSISEEILLLAINEIEWTKYIQKANATIDLP